MSVERESKSWVWVNERRCPECGFDASSTSPTAVAPILARAAHDWAALLDCVDAARLGQRPDPSTWSPIEYGCHVRDVLELLAHRFERTLAEDRPTFPDWHPNDRADVGRYVDERDPRKVAVEIADRCDQVVALVASMPDEGWERRGVRADGLEFTNAWLSTYLTHDVVHHVHDVRRILGV
jgi:hypothetical protein